MIIPRVYLSNLINDSKKWVLVYGRRKTGKTFLVENTTRYDDYFFVNRNRTILNKNSQQIVSYETFLELFKREIADGKTVVVDEFHRLPHEFLDLLHAMKKTGKLILITSTLFLAKKMISRNSPVLGLFNEVKVGILGLGETLSEVSKLVTDNESLLVLSIIAREPLAIDYVDVANSALALRNVLKGSVITVPALVGEIFGEEERTISMIYNGIVSAVAGGLNSTGKISDYLYSRRLIHKNDPSVIQGHLNNLMKIGILRKIQVVNKNKYAYKIDSPLVRIFYYANEKYGISERDINDTEIDEIVKVMTPRIVEDNIREFFSSRYGLIEGIIQDLDYDVDGYLLKFKKPEIALEVKWTRRVENLGKIESNLLKIKAKQHILFVQDKSGLRSDKIEIMDVNDLVEMGSTKQ